MSASINHSRRVRLAKRTSAALRSFIPLPPIMASPTLSPDVAHASSLAATGETHPHPFPTWTTSPPTPPSKLPPDPPPLRTIPPTASVPPRTSSDSLSLHHLVLPASATSPDLPLASLSSNASLVRASTRRMSLPLDLPKSSTPRQHGAPDITPAPSPADQDRDLSVLPSLSRRQPPPPGTHTDANEGASQPAQRQKLFDLGPDEGEPSDDDDPLPGAFREGVHQQKRTACSTDQHEHTPPPPPPPTAQPRADMARARSREPHKQRAERLRRYYALMELLTTEASYLLDLRALVTVYLDQLLLLSTPPATPASVGPSSFHPPQSLVASQQQSLSLPAPSRSNSTFSALSIPSLFPSSRSSFLQPTPAPTPSASASEGLAHSPSDCTAIQERERHISCPPPPPDGPVRERDSGRLLTLRSKARPFVPLMSEKDARAVCRNAQDLLKYHDRFVEELRDVVGATAFRLAFAQGGGEGSGQWGGEDVAEVEEEEIDRTIELVAAKFVEEAAAFGIYEAFCPGHNAAGDVVRRAQERAPAAWDAYEHKCALLISSIALSALPDAIEDGDVSSPTPASVEEDAEPAALKAKRRHSTPITFPNGQLPFPTTAAAAMTPTASTGPAPPPERKVRWTQNKLKLTDYLIKPVQRICKYPLLLDQLKKPTVRGAPKANEEDTQTEEGGSGWHDAAEPGHEERDMLQRALEAMREVTSRVNRESEKEAHNLRSALIHSRLTFHAPVPASGHSSTASTSTSAPSSSEGHSDPAGASTAPTPPSASVCAPATPPAAPRAAHLTADFVSSLGPCVLVGALDVVQCPGQRAKYLGAFLYAGGYCILAKVTKGGRVYEPRHWFALGEVEVVDIEEDDPSYPYTFRVSAHGHHLELAAACAQEKALWMAAVNDALAMRRTWAREPLSSLQADEKERAQQQVLIPVEDPVGGVPEHGAEAQPPPTASARRLSTIQSNSDLEKESETGHGSAPMAGGPVRLRYSKTPSRLDGMGDYASQVAALSRRSSTASVKAFFAPIAFDSRVARPSAQIRNQVEGGLHDVFSESCLAVRAQAQMRGEELFQVRGAPGVVGGRGGGRQQAGVTRSGSGISIASLGFSAARRRYDVVARRKGSVDLDVITPPVPPLPSNYAAAANVSTNASAPGTDAAIQAAMNQASGNGGLTLRPRSLAARRHKKPPSSLAPAIHNAITQMNMTNAEQQQQESKQPPSLLQSPEPLSLDSPPDASRSSAASSALPSPVEAAPLPIPTPGISFPRDTDAHGCARGRAGAPKRSRSVVCSVRSFFQTQTPRSLSRSASVSAPSSGRVSPVVVAAVPVPAPARASGAGSTSPGLAESASSPPDASGGLMQWLRRASLRGRNRASASMSSSVNSMLDGRVGEEEPPPAPRARTPLRLGRGVRTSADARYLDVPGTVVAPAPAPRPHSVGDFDWARPKRHRSLFVSSSSASGRGEGVAEDGTLRRKGTTGSTGALGARKSLRNMLLFQRQTAMTPVDSAVRPACACFVPPPPAPL